MSEIVWIPLDQIDAHPDNPRLTLREEIVETIRAQLVAAGYDEIHSVLLRPLDGRYQTLDGHHRVESARRAELKKIPAWVREYSDDEAFMQLALANAQSPLTPLEYGRHALAAITRYGANGGMSITKYAEELKRGSQDTIELQIRAYEVYAEFRHVSELEKYFRHLAVIRRAPGNTGEIW